MESVTSLFSTEDSFESSVGKQTRRCYRGQKVQVYRNLNKPAFFSILAADGPCKGKVIGYAQAVKLKNASFKVSEKSRQRVIECKRKNVHAFCIGTLEDAYSSPIHIIDADYVTYDPYRYGYFFNPKTLDIAPASMALAVVQYSGVYIPH